MGASLSALTPVSCLPPALTCTSPSAYLCVGILFFFLFLKSPPSHHPFPHLYITDSSCFLMSLFSMTLFPLPVVHFHWLDHPFIITRLFPSRPPHCHYSPMGDVPGADSSFHPCLSPGRVWKSSPASSQWLSLSTSPHGTEDGVGLKKIMIITRAPIYWMFTVNLMWG